ncbi:MAG: hypothetical protein JSS76_14700 [Bacteroidetes bacterium]|nr:hypothetical protein [Bacteroidota bacterium]
MQYIGLSIVFCICATLFCGNSAIAQIADVPAAFDKISTTPTIWRLSNQIKVPASGHLQGIQPLSDSLIIMTGSSGQYAYYLVADHHQVRSIQKIADAPFRHAGGCQIAGRTLLVGAEDNQGKMRSDVYSITFDDAGHEKAKAIVASRSGTFKRSTAGAAGYVQAQGNWLAAIADWDSRNIDLYATMQDTLLPLGTATATDSIHWCAYQSINLIMDKAGKLYLIGMGLDTGKDRADLFLVQFGQGKATLQHIRTRYFKCKGAGFRFGAGIHIASDGKMEIYTCGRDPDRSIPVNIFR